MDSSLMVLACHLTTSRSAVMGFTVSVLDSFTEAWRCCRCNETAISLKASCQLFLRYTTRTNDLDEPIDASKARLIEVFPAQDHPTGQLTVHSHQNQCVRC